jgi:hypothetical protein
MVSAGDPTGDSEWSGGTAMLSESLRLMVSAGDPTGDSEWSGGTAMLSESLRLMVSAGDPTGDSIIFVVFFLPWTPAPAAPSSSPSSPSPSSLRAWSPSASSFLDDSLWLEPGEWGPWAWLLPSSLSLAPSSGSVPMASAE